MKSPVRLRWFDALSLSMATLVGVAGAGAASLAPKANSQGLAVVFAPWTTAADAISRATALGGRFVRFGAFHFIAVVEPEARGYAERVRSNGAWLVADPMALAACLKPFSPGKS